jgi:hypothetical protein
MGMRALLLAMVVTAGCSHSHSVPPDVDAPPGSVDLVCESHGTTFPSLDKACVAATDCFIAQHMISCCGTMKAIGFNVASQAAFTAAETKCAAAYPGCGCAAGPTMAEDGRTSADGTIAVRCANQVCSTYVP